MTQINQEWNFLFKEVSLFHFKEESIKEKITRKENKRNLEMQCDQVEKSGSFYLKIESDSFPLTQNHGIKRCSEIQHMLFTP